MARLCEICGLDTGKFGTRHRCHGKVSGERKPTKLEADKIARGEMTAADLAPKDKPAIPAQSGRLAPLKPYDRPAQARQPQPSLADVLAAIEGLRAKFMELKATLLAKEPPRLDA